MSFEDRKKRDGTGQPLVKNSREGLHPQDNYEVSGWDERSDEGSFAGREFNLKSKLSKKRGE